LHGMSRACCVAWAVHMPRRFACVYCSTVGQPGVSDVGACIFMKGVQMVVLVSHRMRTCCWSLSAVPPLKPASIYVPAYSCALH
jgi:hypothetical protein